MEDRHRQAYTYRGYTYYMVDTGKHHVGFSLINGYIRLPKGHKFFGLFYDDIPIDVHGGWTFSAEKEGQWVIGFDTGHYFDDQSTQNYDYVESQLKQAIDQLCEVCENASSAC